MKGLRKMSTREVKKVVTLDWIQHETAVVLGGLERFRSHKTSHTYPARWSINRGFFKCWNFQGRGRSSSRCRSSGPYYERWRGSCIIYVLNKSFHLANEAHLIIIIIIIIIINSLFILLKIPSAKLVLTGEQWIKLTKLNK